MDFETSKVAWDVLMLGYYRPVFSSETATGLRHVRRLLKAQTTSCYVVRGNYTSKLFKTFRESLLILRGTAKIPTHLPKEFSRKANGLFRGSIDVHWWPLIRSGRWWALHPSGGEQMVSFSDIQGGVMNYSQWEHRRHL